MSLEYQYSSLVDNYLELDIETIIINMLFLIVEFRNIGECNKGHKSIGDPHVEHLHKIRAQGNNCSRNAIKSSTSNVLSSEIQIPGQVDGLQLNTKKWIKIFKCNEKGFLKVRLDNL